MGVGYAKDDRALADEAFDEIYAEGDIDLTFFGQLPSYVSCDTDDFGEEISFGKSDDRRIADAVKLARYFVSAGGFWIGRTIRQPNESFDHIAFDTFEDFRNLVYEDFGTSGIQDNIDLCYTTWILKKLPPNQGRPPVPDEVAALFC